MSTDNHGCHYSGSRGYQQRSSLSNRSHLFPSSGGGVKQDRAGYTGRLIERQASQGEQGVGGERFFPRRYAFPASAQDDCSGSVDPPVGHFKPQGFRQQNTEILVICVLLATVLLDLNILIVQVTLQVLLLCCILSAEIRGCVRLFLQISTYHLLRHLILQ